MTRDSQRAGPRPVTEPSALYGADRHGMAPVRDRSRGRRPIGYSSVTVPPAAVILSRALPENACALTVSATPPRSPLPSTLTGWLRRTAPAATSSSGPTVPPSGNSAAEVADVHDLVLDAEPVLEALELGQPHVQRHLPALERGGHVLAGLRALRAAAGGLAALAALTATDAGLGGLGARGRTQVVDLDGPSSDADLLDRHEVAARCGSCRGSAGCRPRSTDWRILRSRATAAWRAGSACTRWRL